MRKMNQPTITLNKNTNSWFWDIDKNGKKKKNQPTIQSYKAKAPKIKIKEELLVTTLFLEINMKIFWERKWLLIFYSIL